MAQPEATRLPFDEAIDFFRQKVNLPSAAWTDLKEGAHARGFVVAGAVKDQLLADFKGAIDKAISKGTTLAEFRKDFDRIVTTHGWSYKGGRGWRSAVIYNTNLRTAHAAGKWKQIQEVKGDRPYLRYSAIMDGRTRPEHKGWHGLILSVDDPWWKTHFPPNGWNCRCTVQSVGPEDLARYKWTVSETAPPVEMEERLVNRADGGKENWPTPKGIDTGFGYNVGDKWLGSAVPEELRKPLPSFGAPSIPPNLQPLPPPRAIDPSRILPVNLNAVDYERAFLAEFGAEPGKPKAFRDASGTLMAIGEELFLTRQSGFLKSDKRGRGPYLVLLAEALKNPDEIWVDWASVGGQPVLRRRYIANLEIPGRGGGLAVFEWTTKGWRGSTIFPPDSVAYLERQRHGALLWRRE